MGTSLTVLFLFYAARKQRDSVFRARVLPAINLNDIETMTWSQCASAKVTNSESGFSRELVQVNVPRGADFLQTCPL